MIKNYSLTSTASGLSASATTAVGSIHLYNSDVVDRTVNVHIIEGAVAAGATNKTHELVIPTKETVPLSYEGKTLVLAANDRIYASADADDVVIMTIAGLVL